MREKLSTPFLVRRGVLSLRKPPFHRFLGTLCFRCNRDQFLSFREESGMPGTIAGYQVVGDTHRNLFILAELDLENEAGVEAGTVKKVLVPKRDMANGVVLPDRLRAVTTVDRNVCARRVFCGFLGCAILERAAEWAIRFNLPFPSGGDKAGVAHITTAESTRIIPGLARGLVSSVRQRGRRLTFVARSSSTPSRRHNMCSPM
jgi:hypothetical protein